MNPSSLYRISLVICLWQCVELKQVLQLSQQATFKLCLRKFCIEPAVRLEQFKISSRQSCYKECLLKIRNQNLAGTEQTKPFLKRIKRELSNGKDSSAQAVALRGDEECKKASNNATIIPRDNINVTFLKFGDTERLYANVSWNLPPNKTANWTGYKMIYLIGSHKSHFNCRNLEKNASFAIVDNSSKGLLQKTDFYVMLTSLPFLSGDSTEKKFKLKIVELTQPDIETPATMTSSSTLKQPKTSKFPDIETQATMTSSSTHIETQATMTSSSTPDDVKQPKMSRSPGSENIGIKVASSVVASIVVVLIAVAVLVWFYLRRSNLEIVAYDHSLIRGYEFDVFIIYSTADSTWVTEELVPALEKHNINYCIHYKHFIPGVAYTTNMSNSVYNSRKVVAVVSKHFLQSSFCSEELDMALYRLTKEKDDSVIVIKLNDFSNGELPDQLRHRSYIDFTKSTDKNTWEEKLVKVFK